MISSLSLIFPYRWRLAIMIALFIFVTSQLCMLVTRSQYLRHIANIHGEMANGKPMTGMTSKPLFNGPTGRTSDPSNPLHGIQGFQSRLPPIQFDFASVRPPSAKEEAIRKKRQAAVKNSFLHAWRGYKQYALGHDELQPVSKQFKDPFGGWGATLVDGLSTLLVMELHEEFQQVLPELEKINFLVDENISVFESIIRYLGGFLSAFELSEQRYPILLQKAEELAAMLLPAFDTPIGFPVHEWNPHRLTTTKNTSLIAEVGSLQLEFMTLSHHTGNNVYAKKGQHIIDYLDSMTFEQGIYINGLFPTGLDLVKGRFTDAICTFGAMGDSIFEYFLKEYILTDGTVPQYGHLYKNAIDNMKHYMLRQLPDTQFLFLPPFDTKKRQPKQTEMDHLTCFVPGMLAMGAMIFDRPEDMMIAKGILETCVYMYRSSATGLGPETWYFDNTVPYNPVTYRMSNSYIEQAHKWWYSKDLSPPVPTYKQSAWSATGPSQETKKKGQLILQNGILGMFDTSSTLPPPPLPRPEGLRPGNKKYMLRPETLESIFILYRITGDPKYQEYGWEIYEAIEKWCKTEAAYATVANVERASEDRETNQLDSMESFLLAETFKYLYLLFSPPDVISLDNFVFNTEAHPFVRRPMA